MEFIFVLKICVFFIGGKKYKQVKVLVIGKVLCWFFFLFCLLFVFIKGFGEIGIYLKKRNSDNYQDGNEDMWKIYSNGF